jgi:hypothetical protein
MKNILIKITTPDEIEPLDVLERMVDDFFCSDINAEDYGAHMENISTSMAKDNEDLVEEIIRILRIDGELATDGQCLEMVSELLEQKGYGPIHPTINRTGELSE